MTKYCSNCGSEIKDGAKFCESCGTAVEVTEQAPQYAEPVNANNGAVREGIPAPGFSDRVNDPEILAAVKKSRKIAKIFSVFIIPIPFIGFTIYSLVSDNLETKQGMMYGAIISAVFLLFAIYSFIKERAANTYEGVVTQQKSRLRHRHNSSDSDIDTTYTEFITYVKTTDGKKKKIIESDSGRVVAYNYLNEGDRFKYHPQFHFPYELYNKAQAPYIACVNCGTENPVEADRCKKCNLPLLK